MGSAAPFHHQCLNPGAMQQQGQQQPSRACANNGDLHPHRDVPVCLLAGSIIRRFCHGIAQHADAFDFDLDDITGFQRSRLAGRSGVDDIPRFQRHVA